MNQINTFAGPKTIKVTFQSQVKIGRKLQTFVNVEEHTTLENAKLRAMSLNWEIIKVEAI